MKVAIEAASIADTVRASIVRASIVRASIVRGGHGGDDYHHEGR